MSRSVHDGSVEGEDGVRRCPWAATPGRMRDYHDTEWGLPVDGEQGLFERLCLEGFQAGLSWSTILNKRERFREVFHGFDVDRVATMTDSDVERLMGDTGIVRNRAKILATIANARAVIALRDDEGLEGFVRGYRPARTPMPRVPAEVPSLSAESTALSKGLRKRGFSFVGPTTVHALMEATGLIDTHLLGCHRRGAGGEWPA